MATTVKIGSLILGLLAIPAALANPIVDAEYTVRNGQVSQVPVGNSAILVERLIMEDGSGIEISDETSLLVIRAKEARIGNDTTIVGQGGRGLDGEASKHGQSGDNGPTIVLIFDTQQIQGLSVGAFGGDGGPGEPGRGGREAQCSGRDAGNGTNGDRGGNGGDGGSGGNIFLVLPRDTHGYGVSLNVNSGTPGAEGAGGPGGAGGRGKNRCGVWPYWKKGAGNAGSPGPAGEPGNPGTRGIFRTYHVEDFEPATIQSQLQDIISLLANGGYAGDADALRAVLDAGILGQLD